jgi:HEAT repeat protein
LLSSPHANIVSAAAQALGQLHDPRALTPLLNAFFQNPASTWQIARALCELNNPAVIEPLLQRLPAATHEQLFHSLVILNHFPDKRAIEPLWSALSTNITAPNQPYLQMQILFLLGRLGEADAVERLRKLLDTTHLYYRAYVESLLKQLESAQL